MKNGKRLKNAIADCNAQAPVGRAANGARRCARGFVLISAVALCAAAGLFANTPGGEYIHYRLAMQFKSERQYEKAIEEFRKVLAVYPDHYESYMQLAEIRRSQGNHRLVIYNLQRALVYNPGWSKAQLMLAEAFAADGQFDRAVREYQVYLNMCDPSVRDSIQTVINGLMDRMRGAPPQAAAPTAAQPAQRPAQPSAQQAPAPIRLDPRAEEAMRRVISLYEEGKYDEMLVAVREVLAIQPNHPGAYYYAGLVRLKNGQRDMARINFRKALPHPTLGADAARQLALLDGRPAPAGGTAAAASSSTPAVAAASGADSAALRSVPPERYTPIEIRIDSMLSMMAIDTLSDAGQKLLAAIRAFQEGRYDDALREFKRVQTENPNAPIAANCIYNAGICYYRLRLYRDAENQFQLFLDRFASHRFAPRAAFFKASCYQERSDYAVSERLFRQFIQNNRNHEWVGRAYERLGDSFADMEDNRRAMDAYTQALQHRNATHTDKVILNYKLGNAAALLGDNTRAVSFYNTAIDIGERNDVFVRVPDSYYKAADIKFRLRDFAGALDIYKRVTRKYPAFQETPWGLFQIAGAQRNLKQYREAVDTYRELMQKYPDDYWAKQAQWRLEDTIWEHEFRSANR